MIPKHLDEITETDLQCLIEDGVAERKTLDYKRALPGNGDAETKDFLADISSFGNTAGGDLIFGIDAPSGIGEPTGVPGLSASDIESIKLRLEGKIQTGISPRLPRHEIRHIPLATGNVALVIRVSQSWNGPHRVTAKGHGHFYGRNSSGKYQLDVAELRHAFMASESTAQHIRSFVADRIIKVNNDDLPVPVDAGPRMLVHAIPFSGFSAVSRPDFGDAFKVAFSFHDPYGLRHFEPFSHTSSWDQQINLEGRLIFANAAGGRPNGRAYVQLFRTGVLETLWLLPNNVVEDRPFILCDGWMPNLLELVPKYLVGLGRLGVETPIFLFVSVLSAQGYFLSGPRRSSTPRPLDRPNVILPEVLLDSLTVELKPKLKPPLDILWNVCGTEENTYF